MNKISIGFVSETENSGVANEERELHTDFDSIKPKKSVVRVFFPSRDLTLSYFNDMFDLKCGDFVYVEGKLEGLLGRVVEVIYTFKIKLSDYKRVIAVADTNATGEFFFADSHILSFDRNAIPFEKVMPWFNPPSGEEEFVIGDDGESFPLDDLTKMDISNETADRGYQYYVDNKVSYISVDGTRGKAIVCGNDNYAVDFVFKDGEISNLVCSCFCCGACKHEFAVMLQLRRILSIIDDNYENVYNGYFAAITKHDFIKYIFYNKEIGKFNIL